MTVTPVRIDQIDAATIEFEKPGAGTFGAGQFIKFRDKIVVQTPRVETLGCYAWQLDASSPARQYFVFRCPDNMIEWTRAIETRVLDVAQSRSKEWFGTVVDPSVIASWFVPSIKEANMRLSIPFRGDECQVAFFDAKKNPVEFDQVPANSLASVILELDGLWFRNKRFGLSWKLVQVKHYDASQRYSFLPE
jgi:hypothetical protein